MFSYIKWVSWILLLVLSSCGDGGGDDQSSNTTQSSSISVKTGCYSSAYNGASSSQIGCGLLQTLGDPTADQVFRQEIARQSQFWTGIQAQVYVFDECSQQSMNALSFPQQYILFGIHFFRYLTGQVQSFAGPAAVLAHEWGHQIQFRHGWQNTFDPTVRRTELEADAFAGFYLGLVHALNGTVVRDGLLALYSTGDFHFNHPSHHGTPNERITMGLLGVDVAIFSIQNQVAYSYQDLHTIFTQYIGKTYPEHEMEKDHPDLDQVSLVKFEKVLQYLQRRDPMDAASIIMPPRPNDAALEKLFPSVGE